MSQKYEKLKTLLKELFQLDQPDLDFGLYRIMHAKAGEVTQFLDRDLLPQVRTAFEQYQPADKATLQKELEKVVAGVQAAGMDPEQSPKVQELRQKLADEAVDIGALESEVYDHLHSFFRRYYSEGDFLAKRVYKPGVYAIPYEGEEVTLHWANKDQYYIKTSEYLRDYAFRLRPENEKKPMRVHFRLADAAEGEHGNVKAAEGKDRVFILAAPGESGRDFIALDSPSPLDGEGRGKGEELVIRFEYRPASLTDWPDDARDGKNKPPAQKDLTALAVKRVLAVTDVGLAHWIAELAKPHVTTGGEQADYSRLDAHVRRYSFGLLRTILDEVFGRANLISTITVKRATVSGPKVINPGVVNVSDYVLLYAKDRRAWVGNSVYAERERDSRYNLYVRNRSEDHRQWKFCSILDAFAEATGVEKVRLKAVLGPEFEDRIHEFVKNNAASVARLALVRPNEVSAEYRENLAESASSPERVVYYPRPGFSDAYLLRGQVILFYSDKIQKAGQRLVTAERASDIWTDVLPNDVHNEGGVFFGVGKKPEALVARLVELCSEADDLVGDFFLGSGTLGAVAQKLGRRWAGVEGAGFFHDVTLRRIRNVLRGDARGISEAANWKGGGVVRYSVLESYEDALNNLEIRRTDTQQLLLDTAGAQGADGLKEQSVLRYLLDVETRGSQSLLNIAAFIDPTAYKLKVKRPGSDESRGVNVDLLETFNYLIGLTVQHIAAPQTFSALFKRDNDPDLPDGAPRRLLLDGRVKQEGGGRWWFRTVTGTMPDGRKTLVIWRKRPGGETAEGIEQDNLVLDEWFTPQGYSSKDSEFDLIYVNGDNNLENLKAPDDTWKVRLIEEDFHRLMFDTEGV